jgi:hypothetical protein
MIKFEESEEFKSFIVTELFRKTLPTTGRQDLGLFRKPFDKFVVNKHFEYFKTNGLSRESFDDYVKENRDAITSKVDLILREFYLVESLLVKEKIKHLK